MVFYFLLIYISPYNSLRYVSLLLPIFPVLVVGLLQVLPDSFQLRSALLFSVLLVSFNIYGLAKVFQGELPGSVLVSSWRTESVLEELQADASIIVVSSRPKEKIRPVLFHAPPREIAFCVNNIPEDLFHRNGEMLAFVDGNLKKSIKSENIENLKAHGFQRSGSIRSFIAYRRNGADGFQD
ncbi:MAG: hypothetical protein ABIJ42_09600 [Acidobacteriota bacterium]